MTELDFLDESPLQWEEVYTADNFGDARAVQSFLHKHRIPAFVDGQERASFGPGSNLRLEYCVRVPHVAADLALEILAKTNESGVRNVY